MHSVSFRVVTLVALLVVGVAAGCALSMSGQDGPPEDLIRRGMAQGNEAAADAAAEFQRTDRITTVLCGTVSPLSRSGAQACTAVFVNGHFLLFDAGNNALESMFDSDMPVDEVDAVFVTHYHNDHFADLGEVMQWSWISGRQHELPVHGPTGIAQIVEAFERAYQFDQSYRTGHHGEEIMPSQWFGAEAVEFVPPEGDDPVVVYDRDGVRVEAFRATHEPIKPAVGYRVTYAGMAVVLSGDTVVTPALLVASRGANLLVAEAMNFGVIEAMESASRELGDERQATLFYDIREYHMDVADLADLASRAGVERLALTHLMPEPQNDRAMARLFVGPIREGYDGEVIGGRDRTTIVIPLME